MTRRLLRLFTIIERPAAWLLLAGGLITFVSVGVGLVVVGQAKWATLLVAADLVVGGFAAVQSSDNDTDP